MLPAGHGEQDSQDAEREGNLCPALNIRRFPARITAGNSPRGRAGWTIHVNSILKRDLCRSMVQGRRHQPLTSRQCTRTQRKWVVVREPTSRSSTGDLGAAVQENGRREPGEPG